MIRQADVPKAALYATAASALPLRDRNFDWAAAHQLLSAAEAGLGFYPYSAALQIWWETRPALGLRERADILSEVAAHAGRETNAAALSDLADGWRHTPHVYDDGAAAQAFPDGFIAEVDAAVSNVPAPPPPRYRMAPRLDANSPAFKFLVAIERSGDPSGIDGFDQALTLRAKALLDANPNFQEEYPYRVAQLCVNLEFVKQPWPGCAAHALDRAMSDLQALADEYQGLSNDQARTDWLLDQMWAQPSAQPTRAQVAWQTMRIVASIWDDPTPAIVAEFFTATEQRVRALPSPLQPLGWMLLASITSSDGD